MNTVVGVAASLCCPDDREHAPIPVTSLRFCIFVQVAIRTERGIPAIVACMGAHPGSVDVAYRACWALMNLAVNADNKVWIP